MYLRDMRHSSFDSSELQINHDTVQKMVPAWMTSFHAGMAASPSIRDGSLYVGDWSGMFYRIDAATGAVRWQTFVGKAPTPDNPTCMPGIGVSAQATVTDAAIYVAGGDSAVYALEPASGRILWRVPLAEPDSGSYLWTGLTLYQNALYLGVASLGDCPVVRGALARIDLDRPSYPLVRFVMPLGSLGAGVWTTPAIDRETNTVYITTGNGDQDADAGEWGSALLALDATTLEIKAHYFLPSSSPDSDMDWGSSPTLLETADGTKMVAAVSKDGNLYSLGREDLKPLWISRIAISGEQPESGDGSVSTPAFDGHLLYLGAGAQVEDDWDHRGSLFAINPADGSVVWSQTLTGVVLAPVTLTDEVVFAATTQGLIAFDTKTGEQLWSDGSTDTLYCQPILVDGMLFATYLNGRILAWNLPPAQQ